MLMCPTCHSKWIIHRGSTRGGGFRMAAWNVQASDGPHVGRVIAGGFYNGKLEEPVVASRLLTAPERAAILSSATAAVLDDAVGGKGVV